ncbi:hypothetical protein AHAS_Ahas14G0194000 [Arachis hypogaea]
MEATKTSFHTEIGSAGVEPDSVGELMAIEEEVGNELGYLAALFSRFDIMLAFTMTKACYRFCANAKSISIFSILLLPLLMAVALFCVQNKIALPEEESSVREEEDDRCAIVKCFREMFRTMKRLNNMLGFIQTLHGPKHFSKAFN